MPPNYDTIAPYYDRLAKLVFGNKIREAQLFLLDFIPPEANILIAGGGTGWILEEICNRYPRGIKITYVEQSIKMLERSKRRHLAENEVCFLHGNIQDIHFNAQFDVVITPFLLDNFKQETLNQFIPNLSTYIKPNGQWLFTDFRATNISLFQKTLLKTMYLFFVSFCQIEASELPNTDEIFKIFGYSQLSSKLFCNNFIISIAYQKKNTDPVTPLNMIY